MSDLPNYILDRSFDAPRDMVWRAWTDPEILARWYGPNIETVIHKFDLKPGGQWLNEMRMKGNSMFSVADFKEVTPVEKLVMHMSNSDADWNIGPNPMMPDWPRVLLTTVTFEEDGEKTNVRLVWEPYDASAAEIECFAGAMANMGKGWESGYAIMDEIFKELQAG